MRSGSPHCGCGPIAWVGAVLVRSGVAQRIERAGRHRERAVDRVRAGVRADHVAVLGGGRRDERPAHLGLGRAPHDRQVRRPAGVRRQLDVRATAHAPLPSSTVARSTASSFSMSIPPSLSVLDPRLIPSRPPAQTPRPQSHRLRPPPPQRIDHQRRRNRQCFLHTPSKQHDSHNLFLRSSALGAPGRSVARGAVDLRGAAPGGAGAPSRRAVVAVAAFGARLASHQQPEEPTPQPPLGDGGPERTEPRAAYRRQASRAGAPVAIGPALPAPRLTSATYRRAIKRRKTAPYSNP